MLVALAKAWYKRSPQTNFPRSQSRSLMKNLLCKLLVIVCLIPSVSFGQTPVESQIKRVEQGFLPAVLIKGDPPGLSLTA